MIYLSVIDITTYHAFHDIMAAIGISFKQATIPTNSSQLTFLEEMLNFLLAGSEAGMVSESLAQKFSGFEYVYKQYQSLLPPERKDTWDESLHGHVDGHEIWAQQDHAWAYLDDSVIKILSMIRFSDIDFKLQNYRNTLKLFASICIFHQIEKDFARLLELIDDARNSLTEINSKEYIKQNLVYDFKKFENEFRALFYAINSVSHTLLLSAVQ